MLLLSNLIFAQGVAINNDDTEAYPSAMLEIKSNDKGLLIPRMTLIEIEAIANPANGLLVFSTTDSKFYSFIVTDNKWKEIAYGTGTITPIPQVTNPATGKTWMDRNLGASQVATSSTDAAAYGDLFQWGRGTDGHQSRISPTTSTHATTAVPNLGNSWDGLFIINGWNWLNTHDNSLWQGESGTNNPCPTGFRIPTEAEWETERQSWATNDAAGAFGSTLKLTVTGYRGPDGLNPNAGSHGNYWSSTVTGPDVRDLNINSSSSGIYTNPRIDGFSVRCIKD